MTSPVCIFLMLACSAGQFSTAGFGYWVISYMTGHFGMHKKTAGPELAGVTALSCLLGAVLGGVFLDAWTARVRRQQAKAGIQFDAHLRCAIAIKMCAVIGCFAVVASFVGLAVRHQMQFMLALGCMLALLTMTQAPVNIALMEAVAPEHRGMALALNNTIMHLLGDLLSPALVGAVQRTYSLHSALYLCASWLAWCPLMYGIAACALACRRRGGTVAAAQSTKTSL